MTDASPAHRQHVKLILAAEMFDVVDEAADGPETLRAVANHHPDVLLADFDTPYMNGFVVAKDVTRLGLSTQVAILGQFENGEDIFESLRAGVKACIYKPHANTELGPAMRKLARGKTYLSPAVAALTIKAYPKQKNAESWKLTDVQTEIFRCIVEDAPLEEIASRVHLTAPEVKLHRDIIMQELQVSNIGGLIRHAVRLGLIGKSGKSPVGQGGDT